MKWSFKQEPLKEAKLEKRNTVMKVLVIDLDGARNGPLVAKVLNETYEGVEVRARAASTKTEGSAVSRKFLTLAEELKFSKEELATKVVAATPEDISWADKIIVENKNNVSLLAKREIVLPAEKSITLEIMSGLHLKEDNRKDHIKAVVSKAKTLLEG